MMQVMTYLKTAFDAEMLEFNVKNLVNSVHNESVIWNVTFSTCEEDKEMIWIQYLQVMYFPCTLSRNIALVGLSDPPYFMEDSISVSYTHLTLPTIYSV